VWVLMMAGLGLALAPHPDLVDPRLMALTGAAAVTAFWALWQRRYRLARAAAAMQVTLIVWGWGVAQYPYLLPPDLAIGNAAAPRVTLKLALTAVLAGAVVLFPSLFYLFKVFKAREP
jgi:cytochrome d ubiquinol oxidase subunit II